MTNQILQERYEIQQQLGKNIGRKTLLVKDLETQELVVVKLVNFDNDFEWQDLKLFEREAQILEELSHPAIPSYLDSFKVDLSLSKGFGLVQTYIRAKSLEEHLQQGRTFNEAEVKQIATALLEVLNYLHSRQPAVIHRDIKPSNILLGDRSGNHVGDIYLVDFGAVKTTAQQGGTMTVVGTYGYMAQEQFGGRAVPASDLYSLGATLIYLVTGSHPADLLNDEMAIEFEESVNLSDEFINWLKWMTQTILKKRPNSAEAALKELKNTTILESKLVVNKPKYSKVKLRKSKDELEVLIPPEGIQISFKLIYVCCFQLIWTFSVFRLNAGILFQLVGVLVNCTLLFRLISALFIYTRLHINQEKIKITHEIFGIFYSIPLFRSISDISKLEAVVGRTYKTSNGNAKVLPRLIIWAGNSNYELGTINPKEIDWLAQELSDFLDLPVSRDIHQIKGEHPDFE